MTPTLATAFANPLHKRLVTKVDTWAKFKELWERTEDVSRLKGLLTNVMEIGITQGSADEAERLKFLFQVADGWSHTLPVPGGHDEPGYAWAASEVAERAFQVLCDKVFSRGRKHQKFCLPGWATDLLPEPMLELVLWFFRIEKGRLWNSSGHGRIDARREEVLLQFLRDLCHTAWRKDDHPDRHLRDGTWERLVALRPRLFLIMEHLHVLDLFHNPFESGYFIDEAFVKEWKRAVLGRRIRSSSGLPADCRQAAVDGDYAATNLLLVLNTQSKGDMAAFEKLIKPDESDAPKA